MTPYRQPATVEMEKKPMNEHEAHVLNMKRLFMTIVLLAAIGSGTCLATNYPTTAILQKTEAESRRAHDEANKAMWEKMPHATSRENQP